MKIDGMNISVAQKDPESLGMTMKIDGMSISVAQKEKKWVRTLNFCEDNASVWKKFVDEWTLRRTNHIWALSYS